MSATSNLVVQPIEKEVLVCGRSEPGLSPIVVLRLICLLHGWVVDVAADDVCRPVALVTGAGRGIGRAIALRLAQAGYVVIASDRSGQMAAETTQEICRKIDIPSEDRELDVTDRQAVQDSIREIVRTWGRVDLIVSNAMWIRYARLEDVTPLDVDRMLDVGLKGPLWLAQAAQEPMRAQGSGSIVNIASVAAYLGTPNGAVYSAVKGAVVSLTRQLATDLGKYNIRVNAIAPGTIETPGLAAAMTGQAKEYRLQRAPLGRLGKPEDIAEAVFYLAGASAAFVTGQVLTIDGGITAAM